MHRRELVRRQISRRSLSSVRSEVRVYLSNRIAGFSALQCYIILNKTVKWDNCTCNNPNRVDRASPESEKQSRRNPALAALGVLGIQPPNGAWIGHILVTSGRDLFRG
jgi:hypothetical protein